MTRKRKIKKIPFYKKKKFHKVITILVIVGLVFVFYHIVDSNKILLNQNEAVIIDQLSNSLPNQTFVQKATSIMEESGYNVDYIPSSMVTVDFYKNLPENNYEIIIIRSHSTVGNFSSKFALFTSEEYDTSKYVYNQLHNQIGQVKVTDESKGYFSIYPEFIRYCMYGNLNDAVVVMMGCGGTVYPEMHEAFLDKGATAYYGWDERVDITHTDKATIKLLQNILIDRITLEKATEKTNMEIGPDPTYNSNLWGYISSDQKQHKLLHKS